MSRKRYSTEQIIQNLRASRETELIDLGHPSHIVCAWIGNTEKMAREQLLASDRCSL